MPLRGGWICTPLPGGMGVKARYGPLTCPLGVSRRRACCMCHNCPPPPGGRRGEPPAQSLMARRSRSRDLGRGLVLVDLEELAAGILTPHTLVTSRGWRAHDEPPARCLSVGTSRGAVVRLPTWLPTGWETAGLGQLPAGGIMPGGELRRTDVVSGSARARRRRAVTVARADVDARLAVWLPLSARPSGTLGRASRECALTPSVGPLLDKLRGRAGRKTVCRRAIPSG